jgi:hypothetical protein
MLGARDSETHSYLEIVDAMRAASCFHEETHAATALAILWPEPASGQSSLQRTLPVPQGGDRELQLPKFTTIWRLVGGRRDQRVKLRHVFAPPFGNVSLLDAENRSGSQPAEPS